MDKNCIEGAAKQGERASIRKALVTKAKRRMVGDNCLGAAATTILAG
jgi:hypothetical protein